jgi:hypothetical protein
LPETEEHCLQAENIKIKNNVASSDEEICTKLENTMCVTKFYINPGHH